MKYYITQHYTIEHKELYDLTSPINKKYAQDNGFEYVSSNVKIKITQASLSYSISSILYRYHYRSAIYKYQSMLLPTLESFIYNHKCHLLFYQFFIYTLIKICRFTHIKTFLHIQTYAHVHTQHVTLTR